MRASCESFCPDGEAKMRIKEKLLNFYEYKNGQKHVPGLLVKAFGRSAAGVQRPKAKDMRTESCLGKTVEYLLKDILLDKRKPYHLAYDFIFDRLRAVRQEVVIQTYDARQTIRLLEPMIMFLAYSRYRLCTAPIDYFDPTICEQHLQECLKRVLCCYDELDAEEQSKDSLSDVQRRFFMEALYQVFNLGVPDALVRGLTLPVYIRNDLNFKLSFGISMDYHRGNVYRVLHNLPKLPHIICALAALKLQTIRRRLLEVFAHAYHNKQLQVPVAYLLRLTQINAPDELFEQCRHYNLTVAKDGKDVILNKNDFNSAAEIFKSNHETFVDEKLECIYLPEILLLKKL